MVKIIANRPIMPFRLLRRSSREVHTTTRLARAARHATEEKPES